MDPAEVHVWIARIGEGAAAAPALAELLDDEERQRAARLATDDLRARFVFRHALVRLVLAGYVDIAPADLRFRQETAGKPVLAGADGPPFNASHTGDVVVVAVSGGPVGIDVEMRRRLPDAEAMARRFFTEAEARTLAEVPEADRALSFLRAWTRKEAFLKATGAGIGAGLDRVEVTCAAGEPPRILSVGGDPAAAAAWRLDDLDPYSDVVGALVRVVGDRPVRVRPAAPLLEA